MADILISDLNQLRFVQSNKIGYNYSTVDFQNRLYTVTTNNFKYFQKYGVDDVLAVQMAVYDIGYSFTAEAKLKTINGDEVAVLPLTYSTIGDVEIVELRKVLTATNLGLFYTEITTVTETQTFIPHTDTAISWTSITDKVQLRFNTADLVPMVTIGQSVRVQTKSTLDPIDITAPILSITYEGEFNQIVYLLLDIPTSAFTGQFGTVNMTYQQEVITPKTIIFISEPFEVDGKNNCLSKIVYSDSKNYPTEHMYFSTGITFQLRVETGANQLPQVDLITYDDSKKKLTGLNSTFYDKVEIFSSSLVPVWIARKVKFALSLNKCYYNRKLLTLQGNAEVELIEDGAFICTFKYTTQSNELSLASDGNVTGFDNITQPSGYTVVCNDFGSGGDLPLQLQSDMAQTNVSAVDYIKNKKTSLLTNDSGFINLNSALTGLTEATTKTNLKSTDTVIGAFGKIKKWFSSLKALAFLDKVDYTKDIDNIPTDLVQDANYVHTDNNYTNADAQIVANTSGTNTGDQDLTPYLLADTTLQTGGTPEDTSLFSFWKIGVGRLKIAWSDLLNTISHNQLMGLDWLTSGHTGTANTIAGFDASGDAKEYTQESLQTQNATTNATSGTITLAKQTVTTLTTTLTNAHTLTIIPELPTVFTNRNYSEVVLTVGATAPSITWAAPSGVTLDWKDGEPTSGLAINKRHSIMYDWESATMCIVRREEF